MKIIICHHKFQFAEEDVDWDTDSKMGRSRLSHGVIRIKKGMPHGIRESTILHEIIHMILLMNDAQRTIKDAEEEILVSTLSVGLLDFLRGNPDLARQICGD